MVRYFCNNFSNFILCFCFVPSKIYLLLIFAIFVTVAAKAQDTVQIECNFTVFQTLFPPNGTVYSCVIRSVELLNRNANVIITGQHVGNRTNEDVVDIDIENRENELEMHFIPDILYTSFPNVEVIGIWNSGVRELDQLPELSNLIRFNLPGNNVSTITNNTFISVKSLISLRLRGNNIHTLELNAFAGQENLLFLDLGFNELTEFEIGTFNMLNNLESIDLSNNNLQFIDAQLFSENHNINSFLASGNKINRIAPSLISKLPNLNLLALARNECIDNNFSLNTGDRLLALAYVHSSLQRCYNNYIGTKPNFTRTLIFEYRGSLRLFDEFGNAILTAN